MKNRFALLPCAVAGVLLSACPMGPNTDTCEGVMTITTQETVCSEQTIVVLSGDEEVLSTEAQICPADETSEESSKFGLMLPPGDYQLRVGVHQEDVSMECGGTSEVQIGEVWVVSPFFEAEAHILPTVHTGYERYAEILGSQDFIPPHSQINYCAVIQAQDDLDTRFFPLPGISRSGVLDRLLQNKAHIEEFFLNHFPDLYMTSGEVVSMVESEVEGLERQITFTVNEPYRAFNNGLRSAGEISLYTHEGVDQGGPRERDEHVARLTKDGDWLTGAVGIHEWYQEGALTGIHYLNHFASTQEYELWFEKPFCIHTHMTPLYRFRLRLGGPGGPVPFPAWRDAGNVQADCIRKNLLKQVRGSQDFIRRKMMDLSGAEELRFEGDESGFVITYWGSYSCPSELLR